MEMFQKNDRPHLAAMNKMKALMQSADSDAMKNWMAQKQQEFEALPTNK